MKLPPILLLFFVISQCLASSRAVAKADRGNETDHAALLAIKSQLVVDRAVGGVFSSWNHSLHHCYWDGVTCGRKHNRVIMLRLFSRGLVGAISPFIGNLSFLRVLSLYNNSLHGEIPPQIGHLFRLQVLELNNNTLDGEIPANLSACVNLYWLNILNNKLKGSLPLELRALSKLEYIDITFNNFTGPIDVIANLTSLKRVSLGLNAFDGSIPISIGKMQNLITFVVESNSLSGTIPTSIFNCSAIQILDFGLNNLHGEFPPDLSVRLPELVFLNLYSNQFYGGFPWSILNHTNFQVLGLDYNYFTGTVPYDFGRLHNLWYLNLNGNHLEGDINFVGTLVNSTKLETLSLAANGFTGTLPESIGNLSTSLRFLILGTNKITGEIPRGITNLISLKSFIFQDNALTGLIPRDIGKFQHLEWIYLQTNRFTGNIPQSIGNLSGIYQLQGSIPPSIGNCTGLILVNLSTNHLDGMLADKLFNESAMFISIDLSNNRLEGSIPMAISKQTNIVEFLASHNKLSGTIPYGFTDCLGVRTLDIHSNFFHGSIPPSLESLGSLQYLDLSHNNLSGTIPNYFSKFPLVLLNLSYNNFEGEVPTGGAFANTSAIALNGNLKLCGGVPKLHLPNCLQPKSIKKRKKMTHSLKLVVVPILCTLGVVLMIVTAWLYLTWRKKKVPTSTGSGFTGESFMNVSYDMILKATNGFASENLVGVGSFGSVFRGSLDGMIVAVKVLNLQTQGASKSFMAECKALRNLRHRNLVGVITACSSIDFKGNDFKALLYEFMPNGNLDGWLFGDRAEKLTLLQRVDIAIDVAHALDYLHNDYEISVVHCDLKPSNILLDNDMVAKVGDFGLTKFLAQPRHPNQSSSIGILGTIGYVAPEYGLGSEPSPGGDVYSYGVLVLGLITGKRPTHNMFHEGYSLQSYAEEALPDNVLQIVDPSLLDQDDEINDIRTIETILQRRADCIISMIGVGIACSKHVPQDRMKITDATRKLRVARDNLSNTRPRRNYPRGE